MNNIILQPCGGIYKAAQEHYIDTVQNSVSLSSIKQFLTPTDFEDLTKIYPLGECRVWGIVPNGKMIKRWDKVKQGDVALFGAYGNVLSSATVTYKIHNAALSEFLWDTDPEGKRWEYIYFLDEFNVIDLPYSVINEAAPFSSNYIIREFLVVSDEQSEGIFDALRITSRTYVEPVEKHKFIDIVKKQFSSKTTDAERKVNTRTEQAYLRNSLFGRNTIFTCGICSKVYPVSSLATAHIKMRSECSFEQRIDTNVVMPMCRFGCDELYERGYITVVNGEIVKSTKKVVTQHLRDKILEVANHECSYYSDATTEYFKWHYDKHFKN